MVQQSKILSKHIKKENQTSIFTLIMVLQALASNSNGLDGLNSHMVTIDELAAIKIEIFTT